MRHSPASGAVVIMLRHLNMHGRAQAVGELPEQGAPAFEAAIPILSARQGGDRGTGDAIDDLLTLDGTLSSLS